MSRLAVLCLLSASLLNAQIQITYTQKIASGTGYPIYTADLNRDGTADVISVVSQHTETGNIWGFSVSISNGDGTFREPVFYTTPTPSYFVELALGDFDADGKIDVALANSTSVLHTFRGNGDGTLQPPVAEEMGQTLFDVATADFNRDRKLDLVFTTGASVVRSLGAGDGTFATLQKVGDVPNGADVIMTGDFDGDGRADVATSFAHCDSGAGCRTQLYVFYGNGAGDFITPPQSIQYSTEFYFYRAFDLDGDGRTDLAGVGGTSPYFIRLLKGNTNRTFTTQDVELAKGTVIDPSTLAESADIDGDGREDLIVLESDGTSHYVSLRSRQADGTYAHEQYLFNAPDAVAVMVDRFNTGNRPDILVKTGSIFSDGTLHFLLNTTNTDLFPDCEAPHTSPAIRICVPTSSGAWNANLRFTTSAVFTSPLRKIEIWVDGAKRAEGFGTYGANGFLDQYVKLANGQHTASVYAVSFDGLKINQKVTFQVIATTACSAPPSPGIHICSPGSTAISPVTVNATGTTINTTVRMELWVDGTKRASVGGNNLQTSLSLSSGSHLFSFYAFDSSGSKLRVAKSVTVQ